MPYPKMMRIRQKMDAAKVADVVAKTREELARINISSFIKPGQTVALTSGSRGVAEQTPAPFIHSEPAFPASPSPFPVVICTPRLPSPGWMIGKALWNWFLEPWHG